MTAPETTTAPETHMPALLLLIARLRSAHTADLDAAESEMVSADAAIDLIDSMSRAELREVVRDLGDVAWDLGVTLDQISGHQGLAVRTVRDGHVRGWSMR